jgi:DNA adenine methylase
MKTPITYYGGKQRLAATIIDLMPPHLIYVEPFFGGGAVLFEKGVPQGRYQEIINDINSDLIRMYRVMRDQPEEFKKALDLVPYSREEYATCKTPYPDDMPDVEKAWRYFFNLNNSFASKQNGGWGKSKDGNGQPRNWRNKIDHLNPVMQRMSKMYIENLPAPELVDTWDAPQTLFYCDPPYVGSECGSYSGYTKENYHELLTKLDACEGAWILSGYDLQGFEFQSDVTEHSIDFKCLLSAGARADNDRVEKIWVRQRRTIGDEKTEKFLAHEGQDRFRKTPSKKLAPLPFFT